MRISDTLLAMAKWLESPDNKAIILSEGFPTCIDRVALACVEAADILKQCADEVDVVQDKRQLLITEAKQLLQALVATPLDQALLTVALFDGKEKLGELTASTLQVSEQLKNLELPEDITATVALADTKSVSAQTVEKIASLAEVFDRSADASMKKQASVMDELLLTIAAPAEWEKNFKARQAKELEELRKDYTKNEALHKNIGVEEAKKAIGKSEYFKDQEIQATELSTRTCPDHYCPMARVGEAQMQCPLDGRIYDIGAGFKDEHGRVHKPGGANAISEMTKLRHDMHSIFDNRQDRLNKMK